MNHQKRVDAQLSALLRGTFPAAAFSRRRSFHKKEENAMKRTMNHWTAIIVVLALIISALSLNAIAAQRSVAEERNEDHLPDPIQEQKNEAAGNAREGTGEDSENAPSAGPGAEVVKDNEAARDTVADNGKLDGLHQKDSILSKINTYVRSNSELRTNTTVFMFEGGSNSDAPYTRSGVRDQAVAIVVKNSEVVYVESCCSTIPDEPDVFDGVWPSAASVKDGVYPFVPWMFGDYSAFLIAGGGDVPCVRLNSEDNTVITEGDERYTPGRGIFIHTRVGCFTGGWSTGCMLVADGRTSYGSFRDAVGSNTSGYIVIDRTLAAQRLAALYDERGYTGAVKALTGCDDTSTLHFEGLNSFSVERGSSQKISGLVSSNYPLTEVAVSIANDMPYLDDTAVRMRLTAKLDQTSYSLSSCDFDFSGLPSGKFKCTVCAVDASGNTICSSFFIDVEASAR